ncbi:hypothetical protein C8R43DRAFT_1072401 [Mycena crocata]|nr:hypothetical protein C8R43DRAFT_1072401 [Mycena crocata]
MAPQNLSHERRYPSRSLPFNWCNAAEIDAYRTRMSNERKLALQTPLACGDQFSFPLVIPEKNPDSRPVPPILSPNSVSTLRLVKGIQTEADHYSQVWLAELLTMPETIFALKIIQPSMCDLPEFGLSGYRDPHDLAEGEAWGYEHLKGQQGRCVPYFFGIHNITTPCGEAARVLVLEYIPGQTLTDLLESMPADTHALVSEYLPGKTTLTQLLRSNPTSLEGRLQKFFFLMLKAARVFADSYMLQNDVRGPNMILTGSPTEQAVVFVDHYGLLRLSAESPQAAFLRLLPDLVGEFVQAVGPYCETVFVWHNTILAEYLEELESP